MTMLNQTKLVATNPDAAFRAAIMTGRLSEQPTAPNYAGYYMYMGEDSNGRSLFKHYNTRAYLP